MTGRNQNQPKPYVRDEFHSWWHTFEMGAFRTTVVAVGVIALLVGVIAIQGYRSSRQDEIIRKLSEERVMIGVQNEDGVFVSVRKLPRYFVVRYARTFVNNLLVYGPEGVTLNIEEARRMMEAQLAIDYHQFFQETINEARKDYITQSFQIREDSFEETTEGFIVKFRGVLTKFAAQTQLGAPKEKVVTIRIKRVPVTESTREGLIIAGVTDKLPFLKQNTETTAAASTTQGPAATRETN